MSSDAPSNSNSSASASSSDDFDQFQGASHGDWEGGGGEEEEEIVVVLGSHHDNNHGDDDGDDEDDDDEGPHEYIFQRVPDMDAVNEDDEDDEEDQEDTGTGVDNTNTTTTKVFSSASATTSTTTTTNQGTEEEGGGGQGRAEPGNKPTKTKDNEAQQADEGEGEEEEESGDDHSGMPMDQVEKVVAMRLRQLERDYESSLLADISQPLQIPLSSSSLGSLVPSKKGILIGAGAGGNSSPSLSIADNRNTSGIRSPLLAAGLANRPELAAKIEALHRMAASMATGQATNSGSVSVPSSSFSSLPSTSSGTIASTTTEWETFDDFPDDYEELQAKDTAAAKAQSSNSNNTSSTKVDSGSSSSSSTSAAKSVEEQEAEALATSFNPFTISATSTTPTSVSSLVTRGSSLMFIGDTTSTKKTTPTSPAVLSPPSAADIDPIAAIAAATAQVKVKNLTTKLPPIRPISPLKSDTRDAIQNAMGRIHLSPKGGPSSWAEMAVQQALTRGKLSLEAHHQKQAVKKEQQDVGGTK